MLYEEVVSSFSFPAIIIPELRRDIFTFPTVFQDILASPHEFSNKSLKIPLQHKLFIIEDTLNTNFRYSHIEFLTKISDCIQKFVQPIYAHSQQNNNPVYGIKSNPWVLTEEKIPYPHENELKKERPVGVLFIP